MRFRNKFGMTRRNRIMIQKEQNIIFMFCSLHLLNPLHLIYNYKLVHS